MTTNQNRGEQVTAEIGRCPCGAIAGHDGDCQTPMVCVRENELKALQLRVTSLETALMGFLRYFQSGNPIPVERATIMANSEAVRFAESILPPSGHQEA